MKSILKLVLFISFMSLAGCAGIPAKKDTLLANYSNLIVRPLNFNDTTTDKITDDEVAEYKASWPSLGQKFEIEFEKYIIETGYFDRTIFSTDAIADRNCLILETKISSLDPGIRWVMPGNAYYQGILKNSEGKLVGKYSSKRTVSRPIHSTMAGAIETLVTELGEDAATEIGKAK